MIAKFLRNKPKIAKSSFIAPGARLIGAVEVEEFSSVWFNVVARADINSIKIGSHSNIQDATVLHVSDELGVEIGDYVTVGHSAIIHACHIGSYSLIGMGASILNGAWIGEGALVAAGTVVCENFKVPDNTLVRGVPGRIIRELTTEEKEENIYWAKKYVMLAKEHGAYQG